MINQTMKIALLGVRHWHVPLYLPGLPENSVVGVSDGDAGIAARLAAPYGCPAYTDHRQMLHEVKPDFVFAFAPHYRMHAVASELIDARWRHCTMPPRAKMRSARFHSSGGTATR